MSKITTIGFCLFMLGLGLIVGMVVERGYTDQMMSSQYEAVNMRAYSHSAELFGLPNHNQDDLRAVYSGILDKNGVDSFTPGFGPDAVTIHFKPVAKWVYEDGRVIITVEDMEYEAFVYELEGRWFSGEIQ